MDLRGLNPEDVYQLMGSALNLRQIQGAEQNAANRLSSDEAKSVMDAYYKNLDLQLRTKAAARDERRVALDENRVTPTGTYTADGQVQRQFINPRGKVVGTSKLGSAPISNKDNISKLYVDNNGKPFWAKPGDFIPEGSKGFFNQGKGITLDQQFALTSMKNDLLSGGDTSGMDMSKEVNADNAMTMINQYDPNDQFVKIPGREVPGLFNDIKPQYIKLPKQVKGFEALPDDQVVGWVDKDQKVITMAQVRETANRSGSTVADVLRYLELVK